MWARQFLDGNRHHRSEEGPSGPSLFIHYLNLTMALLEGHKANFHTLSKAFDNNDVALMECTDSKTGESVAVICAVERNSKSGDYVFKPFAKMFDGNPYEEVDPPMANGS